jgi:hypothetical protein
MRCGELPEFSILDETDGLADHLQNMLWRKRRQVNVSRGVAYLE